MNKNKIIIAIAVIIIAAFISLYFFSNMSFLVYFKIFSVIFLAIMVFAIIVAIIIIQTREKTTYKLVINNGFIEESGFHSPARKVSISSIRTMNYRPYNPNPVGYDIIQIPNFEGDFSFKEPFPLHPASAGFIKEILTLNNSIKVEDKLAEPYASSSNARVYRSFSQSSPLIKFLMIVMIVAVAFFTIWIFINMLINMW